MVVLYSSICMYIYINCVTLFFIELHIHVHVHVHVFRNSMTIQNHDFINASAYIVCIAIGGGIYLTLFINMSLINYYFCLFQSHAFNDVVIPWIVHEYQSKLVCGYFASVIRPTVTY